MRKKLLALVLAAAMLVPLAACSPEEPEMPMPSVQQNKEWTKPALGENFYGYINYDYLTRTQIPFGESGTSTFDEIGYALKDDLWELITQCAQGDSDDVFDSAIRECYWQYLDLETRESVGIAPLMPCISAIESAQTTDELVKALVLMYQQYGVGSFFQFKVDTDMYDASSYALTLFNMNTCGNMKENFTLTDRGPQKMGEDMEKILEILDLEPQERKQRAKNVVKLINEIMLSITDSKYNDSVELHYFPYSKKEFAALMTHVDTDTLLSMFGDNVKRIIVYDQPQAEKINEVFVQENLRELKDYSLLCLYEQYASALPPSFYENGQKITDEDRMKNATIYAAGNLLVEEVGIAYARRMCSEELLGEANELLTSLKQSCRELIQNSERLSDDGKSKILKKLDSIVFLIGYNKNYQMPFEMVPRSEGGNLLENAIAAASGTLRQKWSKLGSGTVDRSTWDMAPTDINAVYNPYVNSVTLPAVMLSKAAYDPEKGYYFNLGRLGYMLAHEMNHAFDSNGVMFNEIGTYDPQWLSEEDHAAYKEIQKQFIDFYSKYKLLEVYNIDGEKTLYENIADNGAIQCLTNMVDDKEDLQQLFEGVAYGWASIMQVSDVLIRLSTDVHSPAEARVNEVAALNDKFYVAFDIKETDAMYVAPEDRVKVW